MLLFWQEEIKNIIVGRQKLGLPTNVLLEGPPGSSKTWFAEKIADEFEYSVFELRMTSSMKAEDVLYNVAIKEGNEVVYIDSPIIKGFKSSNEEKVVILIDEIDKTRPRAEELLLRALETYKIYNIFGEEIIGIPRNIIIVATSNKIRPLMKPMYRRFHVRYETTFPEKDVEKEIVKENIPEDITVPDAAIDVVLTEARNLRKVDPYNAPSYKEMAELIITLKFVTNLVVAKDIAKQIMWKDDEYPSRLNWVKAVLKLLRE